MRGGSGSGAAGLMLGATPWLIAGLMHWLQPD